MTSRSPPLERFGSFAEVVGDLVLGDGPGCDANHHFVGGVEIGRRSLSMCARTGLRFGGGPPTRPHPTVPLLRPATSGRKVSGVTSTTT